LYHVKLENIIIIIINNNMTRAFAAHTQNKAKGKWTTTVKEEHPTDAAQSEGLRAYSKSYGHGTEDCQELKAKREWACITAHDADDDAATLREHAHNNEDRHLYTLPHTLT